MGRAGGDPHRRRQQRGRRLRLAGILADHGIPCAIYRVSETFSQDGQFYHDQAVEKGVPSHPYTPETDLSGCKMLVDCLLGTGFPGRSGGCTARPSRP